MGETANFVPLNFFLPDAGCALRLRRGALRLRRGALQFFSKDILARDGLPHLRAIASCSEGSNVVCPPQNEKDGSEIELRC